MTDRHSGYHVILDHDIREDDAHHVIDALRMIKGVADVVPHTARYEDAMARARRDASWRTALTRLALDGPTATDTT